MAACKFGISRKSMQKHKELRPFVTRIRKESWDVGEVVILLPIYDDMNHMLCIMSLAFDEEIISVVGFCVTARLGSLLGWPISCWWILSLLQRCLNVSINWHASSLWLC